MPSGLPSAWGRHCATVLELFWKIEHLGCDVERDTLQRWHDDVLDARREMARIIAAAPELLPRLRNLMELAWQLARDHLPQDVPGASLDPLPEWMDYLAKVRGIAWDA